MNKVLKHILIVAAVIPMMTICTSFLGLRANLVTFTAFFGKDSLVQNRNYFSPALGDSVSVGTCRFYISEFRIYESGFVKERVPYKLIDLFDTASNSFVVFFHQLSPVTEIRFFLGVDSAANVSGANKGELDPAKGMYWAWHSGYINMKLEGKSALCEKSRGEFQYHLGGYAAPFNARKEIVLKLDQDTGNFNIRVDLQKFLEQADLKNNASVMSPSAKSVELSGKAVAMFSLR